MWNKFAKKENEKLIRVELKDLKLKDLFKLLTDESFVCFFAVFENSGGGERRVRVRKISNLEDFNKLIEFRELNLVEGGINSEDLDIMEAEYIDCYWKYPK